MDQSSREPKVVNIYGVGTKVEISKANLFLYGLKKGLEKEVAEFRAGQEPAETKAKIVQKDYFTDAAWRSPFIRTRVEISKANLFLYGLKKGLEKEAAELKVVLNFGLLENCN